MSRARAVLLAVLVALVLWVGLPATVAGQPTEADVFVAEGILALEDRQYDQALAAFRRALEREADHIEALYWSGVALMAQAKPAEALPFLERARQKSPTEPSVAFQLGLAYFALNRYDRAEPLLQEVFARDPSLDGLGYYVGFLRYQKQDYQGALGAFRTGRTTDSRLAQLTRLYTGLSLAALGLSAQAATEVEQALRLLPASPLTGPAERLRDAITTSRARERRFHVDVRTGFFFDDNATARPNPKNEDANVHDLRRPKHDTTGELFSLRVDYTWLRQGPWEGTVGYTFFTTYNNDLPSFNIIDHVGSAGVTRNGTLGDMPFQSGVQYSFDYLTFNDKELVQRNSASIFGLLVESPVHLTNALARVEVKEYTEIRPLDNQEFQDAVNWMVGLVHVMRFAEDRHFVKGGYFFDLEDARGRNFAYHGHRFLAGGQYTLPWWDVRASYDFSLHYRDYVNRHSSQPTDKGGTRERSDFEQTHVVRLDLPLPGNFTLSADYQATIDNSNIPVFSYKRNVYTLSLSWQY